DSVDRTSPFTQRVSQGFFDVYILSRAARIDENGDMPVIRGSDENRINVLAIQQRAVVTGHGRLGIRQLASCLAVLVPDIANRVEPHARDASQGAHQTAAPATCSDATDLHDFVGGGCTPCPGYGCEPESRHKGAA